MSKAILSRLLKLEAALPPPGRVVPMFAWGKSESEIKAEQAEMIRRGQVSAADTFVVYTWLEPSDARPQDLH